MCEQEPNTEALVTAGGEDLTDAESEGHLQGIVVLWGENWRAEQCVCNIELLLKATCVHVCVTHTCR